MLHIWGVNGQEWAAVPAEEVSHVLALKRRLQGACGLTRFRQRLLLDGTVLKDSDLLTSTRHANLQLVLLPLGSPTPKEVRAVTAAAANGLARPLEKTLHQPVDPDLCLTGSDPTPLYLACRRGRASAVELLLEAQADKDRVCTDPKWQDGQTPLGIACWGGYEEVVRLLLRAGAEVDKICTAIIRATPLVVACFHGHTEVARLLLEAGADQSHFCPDKRLHKLSGSTPLAAASRNGHLPVVRVLLASRADASQCCGGADCRKTPMSIAQSAGHGDVAELLKMATDVELKG